MLLAKTLAKALATWVTLLTAPPVSAQAASG